MRYLTPALLLAAGLWAAPALADAPKDGGGKGDRPARGEMREKMLKEHDKDGDGKLNENERKAARQSMRERMLKDFDKDGDGKLSDDERATMREKMGKGKKDGAAGAGKKPGAKQGKPGPDDMRGPRDGRGPGAGPGPDGPRGPRGPGRPPLSPDEMFKKFDADKNDSLSREEFNKMSEFVREHRPMGPPPGGPEGRRFRGPGPDGAPPRDGDRPRDGEGMRERWRRGEGRGDRPGPRDFERRRGDRDREGRPDGPPRDRDDKADKAEDEAV